MQCLAVVVPAYDLFLLDYGRTTPGPWLSTPGIMFAANSASGLKNAEDENIGDWRIGELPDQVKRTKYCFRIWIRRDRADW